MLLRNDIDTAFRVGQILSMLQSAATGFFLVDERYRVLLFNEAAPALYKRLTSGELYEGIDFVSLFVEEGKETVRFAIDAAFAGEVTEYEVKHTHPSDGWIKVRYNPSYHEGKCTGVCVTIDDITAKKNLEEKAHRRELKFLSLFHSSGIGMSLVSVEGKLMDVNPALEGIMGYSRQELLHLSFQEITHPSDVEKEMALDGKLLAREIDNYQLEKRYYHKNGSIVWVILTTSLVWKADGTPDFFIGQAVDITAVKMMVKELEAKNNALDFAAHDLDQRIQQLEEFTHMAGHNLRGSVANISSMANMMGQMDAEELPGWLDKLQLTANTLMATLNDLLQFSQVKLAAGVQSEDCNIKAMCEELLAELTALDALQEATVRYDLGYPILLYPKIYLQSILYNLLSNAFKYRRQDIPLAITIKTDISNGRRRLSISDNGTGFDMKQHKDSLFKLNSTFHKGYNSKGIGLFITKIQVEKLGGAISAESLPNKGATFSILFKLQDDIAPGSV